MQKGTQTKQDLFDAFWALYGEKRIEKITIKEITQKAGYNRSTFYEYFTDIYDVLEQLEQSLIPRLDELPPTTINGKTMGMPLESFLALFALKRAYYSVLLGDKGDPAFAGKLKNALKPMLRETLSQELHYSEVELDFILEYLLSAMISIMCYWFKHDNVMHPEKLVALMSDILENGMGHVFRAGHSK